MAWSFAHFVKAMDMSTIQTANLAQNAEGLGWSKGTY
jgi:hypothetical protein